MGNGLIEAAIAEVPGLSLQYLLICTVDKYAADPQLKQVYSLLVISTENGFYAESVFVYDISRSRDRAEEIVRTFRDNTVTPCTVTEILDDIL